MKPLLKSDIKLLIWSNVIIKTGLIALLIIVMSIIWPTMTILGVSGQSLSTGQSLGFIFNHYSQPPTFPQILTNGLANTLFYWVIVLIIVTSYILRDTLKQKQIPCVANHFSPFTLLISKIVVASIYTSCLYSVVVVISILLNCLIIGFPLSQIQIGLMFSFIGLNALAMIAFMSLCCTVCLLFKSSQYAHLTSLFVFLAGGFYKLMSIALNENTRTEIIISGINPFVHTMYFSALNTQRIMPFIIFLVLSLILSFVFSKVILDNRDYY